MFSKNLLKLNTLYKKPYFTTQDISNILEININSSSVFCSRYTKKGIFIKLKNNLYTLTQRWDYNTYEDYYQISSILRVPSYISLISALYYYNITTQIPNGYFENITIHSTKKYDINGITFRYYKIDKKYFNNYIRKDNFFIAEKEKAFLDAIYLYSFGKYRIDFNSIDFSKFDKKKLLNLSEKYPPKTYEIIKKYAWFIKTWTIWDRSTWKTL